MPGTADSRLTAPRRTSRESRATTQSVSESAGQVTAPGRQNPRGSLSLFWVTADGSATAGVDYETSGGRLAFADGEVSMTVTIPLLNDATVEPDETFDVTFTRLPATRMGR